MLSQKYQTLITLEINRILRDLNKVPVTATAGATNESSKDSLDRQSDAVHDELERARMELFLANSRAMEAEKKAEMSEVRARLAEEKTRHGDGMQGLAEALMESPQPQMPVSSSSIPTDVAIVAHSDIRSSSVERTDEVTLPLKGTQ